MVDRLAVDWRTAGLTEADSALCGYAEHLTRAPADTGASDIVALRAAGLDDEGISSATQVVAYFNYINRIAEGLGVGMEDWLGEDGRPKGV